MTEREVYESIVRKGTCAVIGCPDCPDCPLRFKCASYNKQHSSYVYISSGQAKKDAQAWLDANPEWIPKFGERVLVRMQPFGQWMERTFVAKLATDEGKFLCTEYIYNLRGKANHIPTCRWDELRQLNGEKLTKLEEELANATQKYESARKDLHDSDRLFTEASKEYTRCAEALNNYKIARGV